MTVTYEGKTATFTVTVTESEEPEPTLEKIEITGPAKTEYVQGEELDLSGLAVTAVYSDGSKVELQAGDYTVSGYDLNMAGEQTVTVTYGGKTAAFTVTVTEKQTTDPSEPGEGDDQKPGGDDQKPGGDDQKPGGDDQKPGGDDTQKPGGDQQTGSKDPSADGGDGSQAVQTGDTTNIFGAAGVCILALGMAGAVICVRRKRS